MTAQSSPRTALVIGAGRGLGRGIARALAEAGDPVVAVARTGADLAELTAASPGIRSEVADATDAAAASRLLDRYDPGVLVLVAGAEPVAAALHEHSWESFSVNWHSDVKIAFEWLGAALRRPLRPGSRIIVFSSGAAVNGSPASGGYAGAKATQRFLADYTREESRRAGLDLTVTAVLPRMTPHGAVGRSGIRAYAERSGRSTEQFVADMGDLLTPEIAGAATVQLAQADSASVAPAYLLTAAGLKELPRA